MKRIGLIDVDGHNFPNLALMKISAFHKANGDHVEWCMLLDQYDVVYQVKVFDNLYTKDMDYMPMASSIIKGGTGYFRATDECGNGEIFTGGKWVAVGTAQTVSAGIDLLNQIKVKNIHFAWDNPKDKLEKRFARYAERAKHRPHGSFGGVYVLTNFNTTMEENLHRIYTLRDLGFDPYVMIYNKPTAPMEIRLLQRWVNNKIVFKSCERFEDYDRKRG